MKHLIFVIILVVLFIVSASGQQLPTIQPCEVTIDKLPKVHNISLGMSFSEISSKFKNLKVEPSDEDGLQIASVRNPVRPEFADIQVATFNFLNGKLYGLDFAYKSGSNFSSVKELSNKYSALLLIPKNSWLNVSMGAGGGYSYAKCYGFDVKANIFNLAKGQRVVLEIEDINLNQTLMLRKAERREKMINTKVTSMNFNLELKPKIVDYE